MTKTLQQLIDELDAAAPREDQFRSLPPGEQWKQALENKRNIVADSRRLLDEARTEKRDLSEDESRKHTRLLDEAQRWQTRADEARAKMDDDLRSAIKVLGEDGDVKPGAGPIFETRDGKKIRGLLPTERLAANLPESEIENRGERLDFGRALRGIVLGDWHGAEAERRAMSQGSDTAGGFMVPAEMSANIIDLARNQTRVIQAGAVTVPMHSTSLKIARVTGAPTAMWKTENSAITESAMTFGMFEMYAHTLVAMCKLSIELFEDAGNIGAVVNESIATSLALELDRVSLRGIGAAEEPMGLRNNPDVQQVIVSADAAALGYDTISTAWQLIQEQNGPGTGQALIAAPRTFGALDRLKSGDGEPLIPPDSFQSMSKYATNQVPTNLTHGSSNVASEAYVGTFDQLWIGMRTGIQIEISRVAGDGSGSAFSNMQVWIRAYLRADVLAARPERFVRILGVA